MSGGVDSSAVAYMLREAGHDLVGLFMRNGVDIKESEVSKKSCCSLGDARDARMVSAKLGIPFQAMDLSAEFQDVIQYFVSEYGRGRTPNPCAVCNRDLKMGKLLDFAEELGCAGVATGHYARISVEDGRVRLRRGVDRTKDQSYQLFSVKEKDLKRTATPLGDMEKVEVRALAEQAGIRTYAKKDSQEICFVPSNDYRRLLKERGVELHPGRIVDVYGRDHGEHEGTEHFTIGQRRGHGVAVGIPMYVVEIHPEEGLVVVGTEADCKAPSMVVDDLNWLGFDAPLGGSFRCAVQVRYRHDAAPATVELNDMGTRGIVTFDEPQMAVAPGQGAAFYELDEAAHAGTELSLGGGWIESAARSQESPEALEVAR
ncbi:tRNA-specific 2-thiouridylase MnmA [Planctomycetes bacterium Poly30]|uniref:tRNA-specific 2-thiouridylase MnmA n=2 Tax=Saltatorellus ferox TaxID=2528018 RepID=A0A518EU73_9BACT|nr:tRNA-specific 2-thiouridylase MnmA [Planctomycetes bacterium Poly30]